MIDEFDIVIDADCNAEATHRLHGHVYEFRVVGEDGEPYIRGSTGRENQKADHGPRESFDAARAAVEKHAREHELIPAV